MPPAALALAHVQDEDESRTKASDSPAASDKPRSHQERTEQPPKRINGVAPTSRKKLARTHDWPAIERDYRTGRFTLRELGAKHGAPFTSIGSRAKAQGWTQDLSQAVRDATRAAVIEETVRQRQTLARKALETEGDEDQFVQRHVAGTADAVLAAAEVGKSVILDHRADARKARSVLAGMLGELDEMVGLTRTAARLSEVLSATSGLSAEKARETVEKALGLGGRIKMARELADAMRTVQGIERTAFSLDDAPPSGRYEDLLAAALGEDTDPTS